jgi:hypothetical protein
LSNQAKIGYWKNQHKIVLDKKGNHQQGNDDDDDDKPTYI